MIRQHRSHKATPRTASTSCERFRSDQPSAIRKVRRDLPPTGAKSTVLRRWTHRVAGRRRRAYSGLYQVNSGSGRSRPAAYNVGNLQFARHLRRGIMCVARARTQAGESLAWSRNGTHGSAGEQRVATPRLMAQRACGPPPDFDTMQNQGLTTVPRKGTLVDRNGWALVAGRHFTFARRSRSGCVGWTVVVLREPVRLGWALSTPSS